VFIKAQKVISSDQNESPNQVTIENTIKDKDYAKGTF
jgi:hypothetical protein